MPERYYIVTTDYDNTGHAQSCSVSMPDGVGADEVGAIVRMLFRAGVENTMPAAVRYDDVGTAQTRIFNSAETSSLFNNSRT